MPLAALPIRPTQPPYRRPTLGAGAGGCIVGAERVPLAAHFAPACSRPTTNPTPPKKAPKKAAPARMKPHQVIEATEPKPAGAPAPAGGLYFTLCIRICLSTLSIEILNTRLFEPSTICAHIYILSIIYISRSSR